MLSWTRPIVTGMAVAATFAISLSAVPVAASAHTTVMTPRASLTHRTQDSDAYIYVSDAYYNKVYVYRVGEVNPAPIREIDVFGTPTTMAVANNGNLYVAVGSTHEDNIFIYSPGGGKLVGSIGYENGVTSIRDFAFDSAQNLYVSGIRTVDGFNGVMEFAAGSGRAIGWFGSPTSQNYGVTLDAQDNLFIDLGMFGTAIEYAKSNPANFTIAGVDGAPTPGGLAFLGKDLVMTGGTGLWIFTPSAPGGKYPYMRTALINYGVSHGTGYPARGSNGSLYVPVADGSGGHSTVHEVRIYNQVHGTPDQYVVYSTITSGLQFPRGVAVGPG
jgi:hypothetical protein